MKESAKYAAIAYKALDEKKGEDIRILDISNVSIIADYFVIASGANTNQLLAMCDEVQEKLGRAGLELRQMEGNRSSSWILLDYGDVIIHLFSRDDRLFYDLERVWGDGKEIGIDELEKG